MSFDDSLVLAHGGVEGALPMPLSLFVYALLAIVLVAYLALRVRSAPVLPWPVGRLLPGWFQGVVRGGAALLGALGLVGWVVVLTAALFGNQSPATNITWLALSAGFLALFPVLSVLFGDLWRAVSPYRTLARGWTWLVGADGRGGTGPLARIWAGGEQPPAWAGWVAPVGVLSLGWCLLARESPEEPAGLGVWLLVYSLVILAGTLRWGMAWVDRAEGFGVLFGLFASLAPLRRTPDGVVLGPPLVGPRGVEPTPGAAGTLAVALALVLFDGFSTADPWIDVVQDAEGAMWTLLHSVGLLVAVALVVAVALGLARIVALDGRPDALALALVPGFVAVVAGATVAHDLPVVLIDGQFLPILASDPYGQGWDLFGTRSNSPDFELLSAATFAWLESAAVAIGVVGSMLVGHDLLARRKGAAPLVRSLFVWSVAVAAAGTAALVLVLGAGGE